MKKEDLVRVIRRRMGDSIGDMQGISYIESQEKLADDILSALSGGKTLTDVKEFLKKNYLDGCDCPACGQNVKLYERNLTSAMAYGLILLVNSGNKDFFHIENFLKEQKCPSSIRGDIAKLRYFKLIERQNVKREDGSKRAGYYKLTDKAYEFVKNKIVVPKFVTIYNKKMYGISKDYINIEQALGNKFNYNDLMNNSNEIN